MEALKNDVDLSLDVEGPCTTGSLLNLFRRSRVFFKIFKALLRVQRAPMDSRTVHTRYRLPSLGVSTSNDGGEKFGRPRDYLKPAKMVIGRLIGARSADLDLLL